MLEDAEDAWSGEEYFKHTDSGGLSRFVRPDRRRREKYNIRELNALEAYQFMESDDEEEGGEEETNVRDPTMHAEESPQEPEERVELPGEQSETDPEDILGPIPPVGVNWDRMEEIIKYLPPRQAQRVERVREVRIFNEYVLIGYCKVHLMTLYPGQPDMIWDYAGWWRLQKTSMGFLFSRS